MLESDIPPILLANLLAILSVARWVATPLIAKALSMPMKANCGFADLVAEGAYKTFPADDDGILPLMDDARFDDDVTSRVKEFVLTVWGEEHLQENLEFIAESLCLYAIKPKKANLRWIPSGVIFPRSSGKII